MSDVTLGIVVFLAAVAGVMVWKLFVQGEVVGEVHGTRDKAEPSAERVRLLVKRATAQSGDAVVQLHLRVALGAAMASLKPGEALELAAKLEETASAP